MEVLQQEALLIIDEQRELFDESNPSTGGDQLLTSVKLLVDRAHAAGAPVFFIQHSTKTTLIEGSGGWQRWRLCMARLRSYPSGLFNSDSAREEG